MTAPPEFRREVIRQANRRACTPNEVSDLLDLSDWAYAVATEDGLTVPSNTDTARALIETWEQSYDVEP